jgi:RNA polymerase sigma-70 factor (ECF subfamily)
MCVDRAQRSVGARLDLPSAYDKGMADMVGEVRTELERRLRDEHAHGRMASAATIAIREYGAEVLGFLVAVLRSNEDAAEVFAQFCEDLWSGLPRFRWDSSLRTWAYTLARHAACAFRRDPHRRRRVGLSEHPEVAELEAHVRTATVTWLCSDVKHRVQRLRESLEPEDQTLLILRVDRQMSWNDVAMVMRGENERSDEDVSRRAAVLRKRFERVKERLRALATS